ncbi:hypothetical protein IVB12_16105 [Bradyrhizobium sp. 179]|uniref:hypothetical protein n=1 Tax=Bradyrhizobium sp. 179 TaxID=2782648 RepID=UPI001FF8F785|nr:hypothetical protein [Bradyrhizobium sp. 179]MCK1543441.1 hypothetical protein [Bradyrhizobium sp. 179]
MSGFIGNGPSGVGRFSRFQFTAIAGQTVFGGTDKNGLTLRYTPGQVEGILNGSWLAPDDITATDGSTITIARPCSAGDTFCVFAPTSFGVADSVSYLSQQQLTAAQQAVARANIGVTKKNYIVNGGMMVSQENGAVAGSASGYYPVDQWSVISSIGGFSVAQVASPTPGGSPNRIRFTVTTADAAPTSKAVLLSQNIEGNRVADLRSGSASAKTVVVQFGCRGPAGTYGVTIRNGGSNRSYVSEITITAAEANTDVVKSVVVPLDTTGTWLTDTGIGMSVSVTLMGGSGFLAVPNTWTASNVIATANQFNFMGTVGNVFELFDVGLYEGTSAPAFQLSDLASELAICQRYYWQESQTSAIYNEGTSTGSGSNALAATLRYPVPMRATPTVTSPTWASTGIAAPVATYVWTNGCVFQGVSNSGSGSRMYMQNTSTIKLNARM